MMDSIRQSLEVKPSFTFRFDSRQSFITARPVKIFGFKVGLDHRDQVQYGIGFNALSGNSEISKTVEGNEGSLRFFFIAPYFQYTFYNKGHWELGIPVQVGVGGSWITYTDAEGEVQRARSSGVLTYEPAMSVQYKFWKFFGIGTGLGYRIMVIPNKKIDEDFTAPVYMFRFKVYLGKVYNAVFKGEAPDDS